MTFFVNRQIWCDYDVTKKPRITRMFSAKHCLETPPQTGLWWRRFTDYIKGHPIERHTARLGDVTAIFTIN
jgi:hypothetical protein